MTRRQLVLLVFGLVALVNCATDLGRNTLLAQTESAYERLKTKIAAGERWNREDRKDYQSLGGEEQAHIHQLRIARRESRRSNYVPAPPESGSAASTSPSRSAPSHSTLSILLVGFVMLIAAAFVLFKATQRGDRQKSNHLLALKNHVAQFQCPDCRRPICLLGASRAWIQRIPHTDPRMEELDSAELTPRQQVALEAIWIGVHCIHCDQDLCFDDVGVLTTPPEFLEEPNQVDPPKARRDLMEVGR